MSQGFAHDMVTAPPRPTAGTRKAKAAATAAETAPVVPVTPLALSDRMVTAEHRSAKASGQIRLVLGLDDKGKAVRLVLAPITAHTGSGEQRRAGWSVCHTVTNPDNAVRYFAAGKPVGFGDTVKPPRTAAKGWASTITRCALVGFGLAKPVGFTLEPVDGRAGTVGSLYGATVSDASGAVWSVQITVRTPKASGAPWTVNARIYSGGPVDPTNAELVADAATAARCPADELRSAADALDGITPKAAPKAAAKAKAARGRAAK